MPTTEERIRKLVDDNLEIDGRTAGQPLDTSASLRDSGVSSVDFVAFAKLVADEFGLEFNVADCADVSSVGDLVQLVDSRTG